MRLYDRPEARTHPQPGVETAQMSCHRAHGEVECLDSLLVGQAITSGADSCG